MKLFLFFFLFLIPNISSQLFDSFNLEPAPVTQPNQNPTFLKKLYSQAQLLASNSQQLNDDQNENPPPNFKSLESSSPPILKNPETSKLKINGKEYNHQQIEKIIEYVSKIGENCGSELDCSDKSKPILDENLFLYITDNHLKKKVSETIKEDQTEIEQEIEDDLIDLGLK